MSDTTDDLRERLRATRDRQRERIRELEMDAVLIRGKIEEAREAIQALDEVIEENPRRRAKRRITIINMPDTIAGAGVPGGIQETPVDEGEAA